MGIEGQFAGLAARTRPQPAFVRNGRGKGYLSDIGPIDQPGTAALPLAALLNLADGNSRTLSSSYSIRNSRGTRSVTVRAQPAAIAEFHALEQTPPSYHIKS